jgi:hypothetical protein
MWRLLKMVSPKQVKDGLEADKQHSEGGLKIVEGFRSLWFEVASKMRRHRNKDGS